VFDCEVVLHLKLGNSQGSTQDHTATCCRLSWVLIPGPLMRLL